MSHFGHIFFKLAPMVPLVETVGSQYCRQSTVWAKLPRLESHMIQYGVLNFKFRKKKKCLVSGNPTDPTFLVPTQFFFETFEIFSLFLGYFE